MFGTENPGVGSSILPWPTIYFQGVSHFGWPLFWSQNQWA